MCTGAGHRFICLWHVLSGRAVHLSDNVELNLCGRKPNLDHWFSLVLKCLIIWPFQEKQTNLHNYLKHRLPRLLQIGTINTHFMRRHRNNCLHSSFCQTSITTSSTIHFCTFNKFLSNQKHSCLYIFFIITLASLLQCSKVLLLIWSNQNNL